MQFDIFNPCSSSLVCAAHFKPWSSAARGGEVGEEQVGAPLVCEGLGRAGCGMDARAQDKEMALLLCCHCSPGCLTYSYLHTCPTQTRASPPLLPRAFSLAGRTLLAVCASAAATTSLVLYWCQAVVMVRLLVPYRHKPKEEWGKITVHPSSCFFLTFSEIT